MHAWLHKLDQHFPVRYSAWLLSAMGLLLFGFTWVAFGTGGVPRAGVPVPVLLGCCATCASAGTRCCATTR
jgi:hypothetical protein